MELLCIQSQEHPELPLAELRAVMECENIDAEIDSITEGLVVLKDISQDNFMNYYRILTRRLGYTHEVHEHILRTDVENLEKDVSTIDWSGLIDENFAVRVKRIRSQVDTVAYERKLGTLILENSQDIHVNLSKPNTLVRVVAHGDDLYVGIERIRLDKKHFEDSKPHKRPFFYPGSMNPKLYATSHRKNYGSPGKSSNWRNCV